MSLFLIWLILLPFIACQKPEVVLLIPKAMIGQEVSLKCNIIAGSSPFTFAWKKNGQHLENSIANRISEVSGVSFLNLPSVSSVDAGNYSCQAKNSFGEDIKTAQLIVNIPATWVIEPNHIYATFGGSLSLSCSAEGSPDPQVALLFKNEIISKGQSLVVMNVSTITHEHEGSYSCIATNSPDHQLRKDFTVTVHVPAKIVDDESPSSYKVTQVKKGDSIRLECKARGDRPVAITWFKGHREISRNRVSDRYEVFDAPMEDGIKSELFIRTVDREDGDQFTCKVSNSYGKDETTNKVVVLEVPSAPTDLKVHQVWSRSARLSWSTPFSGNSPMTGFIVQFWKTTILGDSNKKLMEEMVTPAVTEFILANLDPGSVYELSVTATNEVGRGPSSAVIKFKTGEEEPSGAPIDVSADGVGPSTIRVTFRPPPEDKTNGLLRGFYVGYRQVSDFNRPYTYRTVDFNRLNQTYEVFLSGLRKGVDYSIRVKSFNSAGMGADSTEVIAKTLTTDLPPAPRVHLLPVTANTVSLLWRPPSTDGSDVKVAEYRVHYRPDYNPQWKQVNVNIGPEGHSQEFTVGDLEANTLYYFYVTSVSPHGEGDPSQILFVKTRVSDDDSFLSGHVPSSDSKNPFSSFRLDFLSFVSITAASVVVIVVIIISYACIKKAQLTAAKPSIYADFVAATLAHRQGHVGHPPPGSSSDGDGKSVYVGGTHRYIEFDANGRPVKSGNVAHVVDAQGNMFPAPYASLSVQPPPGVRGWRPPGPPNDLQSSSTDPPSEGQHVYDYPE